MHYKVPRFAGQYKQDGVILRGQGVAALTFGHRIPRARFGSTHPGTNVRCEFSGITVTAGCVSCSAGNLFVPSVLPAGDAAKSAQLLSGSFPSSHDLVMVPQPSQRSFLYVSTAADGNYEIKAYRQPACAGAFNGVMPSVRAVMTAVPDGRLRLTLVTLFAGSVPSSLVLVFISHFHGRDWSGADIVVANEIESPGCVAGFLYGGPAFGWTTGLELSSDHYPDGPPSENTYGAVVGLGYGGTARLTIA